MAPCKGGCLGWVCSSDDRGLRHQANTRVWDVLQENLLNNPCDLKEKAEGKQMIIPNELLLLLQFMLLTATGICVSVAASVSVNSRKKKMMMTEMTK